MRAKITQGLVEKAPAPPNGKSSLYADTELRGFYLIVTPTKRSYYVQSLVSGRQVRVKVGEHPALSAKDARDAARQTLVTMRAGANPNQERRKAKARGMTLRGALELHLAARDRSDSTTQGYRYQVETYLRDWLDRPVVDIGNDRGGVRERHKKLSERHGRTTADYTMRVLRAVYNRALREHPEFPSNPTANVDFHGQQRRQVHASADRLKAWGQAVLAIENPVRRDLHLFIILTGMRRTAAVEARVEHLDLARGILHVPRPKGGAAKSFDLPLSGALLDLLRTRAAENARVHRGSPWLFPSDSSSGHVAEVQQEELGELVGHALRHVYATLALEAGVPLAELRFLLNHKASSGGVTMGYLHPSVDHLRRYQELASARVLSALGIQACDVTGSSSTRAITFEKVA